MKKLRLLIVLISVSFLASAQTPTWQWAKGANGLTGFAACTGITVDATGNSYIIGEFASPKMIIGNDTLNNAGYHNVFVAKYDAHGNAVWAKSASGTGSDQGTFITLDAFGNLFITGSFASPNITFGSTILTNVNPSGFSDDYFVTKYDTAGNLLWAKRAGGKKDEVGWCIGTDAGGNLYAAGNFSSPTITFGSTVLTNVDTSGTNVDIFLVKYDPSGNVIWAKSAGGLFNDSPQGIAVDASDNLILTGYFYSTSISFGSTTLTNTGTESAFVAKYDSSGKVLWAKNVAGYYSNRSVTLDVGGNVYVSGEITSPTVTFGNTTLINTNNSGITADFFLTKYDTSGNILWAKSGGGSGNDFGTSIIADATGNTYLTGAFSSPFMILGSDTLKNAGTDNFYVLKYDASGNLLWTKAAGGTNNDITEGIGIDAIGNAYVAGSFSSVPLILDGDTLTTGGPTNFLIARLIPNVATPVITNTNSLSSFNIFPNPNCGSFTVMLNGATDAKPSQLIVTNMLGEEVYTSILVSNQTQINLTRQPKGIYFVQVKTDQEIVNQKIIIQ